MMLQWKTRLKTLTPDHSAGVREDSFKSDLREMLNTLEVPASMSRLLRRIGLMVDASSNTFMKKFGIDIASVPGIEGYIELFVNENMRLIKDIPKQMLQQSLDIQGQTTQAVTAQILERWEVAQSRALLIARDQVLKLNSDVTAHRAKAAGIRRFRWNTASDERVRSSHQELDGRVFDLDNPPSEGLPGTAIQCRCTMAMLVE